jgi:histidinol-phosphate aminotransferase
VRAALERHAARAFRYPQGGNPRLVAALAGRHGLDAARVVVGNGSDELIDLLVRVRAVPGRHNVVTFRPCFSIYALQTRLCGVELRQARLKEDFSFDYEALLGLVDAETALVFVTTPDNPSGHCPPAADLAKLARALPEACLLVLDEAYMDFAEDESVHSLLPELDGFPNVAVLRTFSKSFGLAGLRLGYALLPPRLAEYLWRVRLPFSVNILAEEAGLAALRDVVFREESLRVVRNGRETLSQGLRGLGCRVWPSQANFVMFRPPAGSPLARDLFERLLRMGIIIRPLTSYGLPDLLRVSVGTEEENLRFLDACNELFPSG